MINGIICFNSYTFCQYQATRLYTKKDGLPTNEIYQIEYSAEEDILTIAGGGFFENFDGKNFSTIFENEIASLVPSIFNFFTVDEGIILQPESGSRSPYFFVNGKVAKKIALEEKGATSIFFDRKTKELFCAYKNIPHRFNRKSETLESIFQNFTLLPNTYIHHFRPSGDGYYFQLIDSISNDVNLYEYQNDTWIQLYSPHLNLEINNTFKINNSWFHNAGRGQWYKKSKSNTWEKFEIQSIQQIDKFSTHCPSQNTFLFPSKINNNTYELVEFSECFPNGVRFLFKNKFFIDRAVKDGNGNYWMATRSGLLKMYPAFEDFLESYNEGMISDLHALNEDTEGKIWFASYSQGISYYDGSKISPHNKAENAQFLPGSAKTSDGKMLFCPQAIFENDERKRGIWAFDQNGAYRSYFDQNYAYYLYESNDGELAAGLQEDGLAIKEDKNCDGNHCWKIIGPEKGLQLKNVITTVKDKFGRWWMGRPSTGIAVYDPKRDTVFNYLRNKVNGGFGGMASYCDYQGNIWFGTHKGLFILKNQEDFDFENLNLGANLIPIGNKVLANTQVNLLNAIGDSILVVGNSEGVGLIHLKKIYEQGKYHIKFFDEKNGYTGEYCEQNATLTDSKGNIWLASDIGAHRLNPNFIDWESEITKFALDSILVNGQIFPYQNGANNRLSSDDKNVEIHYSIGHNLRSETSVFLSYSINNEPYKIPAEDGFIELSNLRPDDYILRLKTTTNNLDSDVQEIKFSIPKPIEKNPFFWITILGLGLIGFLLIKRRNEIRKNTLDQLQIQAITNQLNPHFINNSLNWVQMRVYQDEEAAEVIKKLSENIKTIFIKTKDGKSFHSLKSEMVLVNNYLNIQKKRFGDRFDFKLPKPEELERFKNVNILLMLFQIHFENAIEHGIGNIVDGRKGFVNFKLFESEDFLEFHLEDNGVGRKAAANADSSGTQKGVKMLQQLIVIFNRRNHKKLSFYYEDDIFTKQNGTRHGTRVIFQIPQKFNYELQ